MPDNQLRILDEFDNSTPFKHGDIVKLKSSPVKMTVERAGNGVVICVWFHGDKLCRERLPFGVLELAT